MGRRRKQREADVIVGVVSWQGSEAEPAETDGDRPDADVILFAPYLLSRRGRTAAPPRHA